MFPAGADALWLVQIHGKPEGLCFVPFFLFQNVYAFVVIRKAKGGGDVNKPQFILGVHDLPRPRGEGFLYYKLYPGYHERILVYFNLYNTEEQELKGYFSKGIRVML